MFQRQLLGTGEAISDKDILYVIGHFIEEIILDGDPTKVLYVGLDLSLRELEVITVEIVNGEMRVIHAMKARKSTVDFIRRIRDGQ